MNPLKEQRRIIIIALMVALMGIYLVRLFSMQVIDRKYKDLARNNAIREVVQQPPRGLIYDRNDSLLVYNEAAYDLMVTPNQLHEFDTALFCQLLGIDKEQVDKRLRKAKRYSYYKSSVFLEQISAEQYGAFQENLYQFKGFYAQTRSLRIYPHNIAAHTFGYVGEVDDKTAQNDSYYKSGDYIGISGVERMYEEQLRGKKGVKIIDSSYNAHIISMTTVLDMVKELHADHPGPGISVFPGLDEGRHLPALQLYGTDQPERLRIHSGRWDADVYADRRQH